MQDKKETGEAGSPACWGLASQMLRLIGCLAFGSFEMQAFSVTWARTAAHSGYPGKMCPFLKVGVIVQCSMNKENSPEGLV